MPYPEKKEEEKSFAAYFLILSFLLVAFSVWVFWEEVVTLRPWKSYQKKYYALKSERIQQDLEKAREELKQPKIQQEYQQLRSLYDKEREAFDQPEKQAEYRKLSGLIREAEEDIAGTQNKLLVVRNELLEEEYQFMRTRREKNKIRIAELNEEIRILEEQKRKGTEKKDDLKKQLKSLTLPMEEYAEKLASFPYTSRVEELEKLLAGLRDPETEIKQYHVEDLKKVDRCTSCHVGIESPQQADYPPPYKAHPGNFIYIENHPPEQFGCTICHQGQGRATTSLQKAHGRVEFWDEPMFEGQQTQASCQHCHQDVDDLRGAETLREGDTILKKSVCFGCHRIDGYENIPKISPPLSRVGEKVSYTWLVKWLMNPSEMMEGATMPNYHFSKEEARAVADYLFSLTQKQRSDERAEEDVDWSLYDRGKIVYSQSICSICHAANGRGGAFKDMYAPDLSRVGSKIKKEWLRTWFRDPKKYFQNARMSHYRLTDEEIDSLSEYLRGEYVDWDLEEVKENRPSIIQEANLQRGAFLIKEYGCFGCHDIQGMRDIQEIGPYLKINELEELVADELTSFGDKPLQELDFGRLTEIPQTRIDYLRQKLKAPRDFRDDARMPTYNFSEEEITALLTLILGFSKEEPLVKYRVEKMASDYQPTGEFAGILDDVKCLSCHKIYGQGADYAPDLSIEGSKVKEAWLKNYLKSPDIIRPLSEQMPKFNMGREPGMSGLNLSRNEIDILTDYIMTVLVSDDIDKNFLKDERPSQAEIEKGKKTYFNKGCQSCHQIGQEGGAVGPALTAVGSRLTAGYIFKHLLNPRIINRNTVEPDLGLSKEEALALTKYLMTLKGRGPG